MRKERAGTIEWRQSGRDGIIELGLRRLAFHHMSRKRKPTSKSRHFLGTDSKEYKWRRAGVEERDFECVPVTTIGQPPAVAYWTSSESVLRIAGSAEPIMDDFVTTFLVHMFRMFRQVDWTD